MSKTLIFYKVSTSQTDSYYTDNLTGTNLLTVAEEQAKEETKNQATRFIHKHTLETYKTFKVEDKPRQTRINKQICDFEGCNKAPVLGVNEGGTSHLCDYCHIHAGLLWHAQLSRSFVEDNKYGDPPYFTMPKTTKANAERLLRRLINHHEHCDKYGTQYEGEREILIDALKKAGMRGAIYERRQVKTVSPTHHSTIKQMCWTVIEAGGLA